MIKDAILALRDFLAAMDGRILNTTTGQWEAATAASTTAARTAVDETIAAIVAALPPLFMFGVTIPAATVQAAANKIVAILKAYFEATTK